MGDIKLFKTDGEGVCELKGTSVALEKSLQTLIEKHLETLLGTRFLGSEYSTGKKHGGRIDTLGIDENGCPVIIEYKRAVNENVINQGLFYLDWLLDHKAEFELLVQKRLGVEAATEIEWSSPRLLCIAGDFTKYDGHAVAQINRNIELIRYRRFGEELLLLDLVNATAAQVAAEPITDGKTGETGVKPTYKTVTEYLAQADKKLQDLFHLLCDHIGALGDDVQRKTLKYYYAFKRLKNFACIAVSPQIKTLSIWLKVDPDSVELEKGFTRDVRKIGHFGTGDLEVTIRTPDGLERAKPLILSSYESN